MSKNFQCDVCGFHGCYYVHYSVQRVTLCDYLPELTASYPELAIFNIWAKSNRNTTRFD